MYLYFDCHNCKEDEYKKRKSNIVYYVSANIVNDDGYFEFTCPNNHRNRVILIAPKFDILFMIGENAVLDGYFREAISSFHTSLERAYEEYIRFMGFLDKIPESVSDKTWKHLVKQSERQFGAFTVLWLTKHKEDPKTLPEKYITLRNNVIHNGYLPSMQQTIEFGKSIIEVIEPIFKEVVKHELFYKYLDSKIHLEKYVKSEGSLTRLHIMTGIRKKVESNEDFEKHLDTVNVFKQMDKRDHFNLITDPSNPKGFYKTTVVTYGSK
ncbi:MAG: hypothetical protein Q8S39_08060 [Ignavibacteria bacterium]|nr:hypothetical protein [Ignavibacteria bacterium]